MGVERARSALSAIDAGCGREQWIRVGMAAKAAGLDFEDFDNWSSTGGNYKGKKDCLAAWRSFKKEGNTKDDTLFYFAFQAGWQDTHKGEWWQSQNKGQTKKSAHPPAKEGTSRAAKVWQDCLPVLGHGYIERKQGRTNGLRVYPSSTPRIIVRGFDIAGWLAVPCWQDGELQTIQFIPPDGGAKLNLPNCQFNDGFFAVGDVNTDGTVTAPPDYIFICEGIGQAWACLAWADDYLDSKPVMAVNCFGSGRMQAVANMLSVAHPYARIVVVPDRGKEEQGLIIAASVQGCCCALPPDLPSNYDINDLLQAQGMESANAVLSSCKLTGNVAYGFPEEQEGEKGGAIDYIIPFPGLARDIQQWILAAANKKQPAISFVATMAILSTVIGRNIELDGIKGNLLMAAMAESGEGKDWPIKAVFKVLDAVGLSDCIHGKMASGAALMEAMTGADGHTVLMLLDELGHYMGGINGKYSSSYAKEIMPMMTELYTSAGDWYKGKKTKGNEAPRLSHPHLTLMGFCTARQILETMKSGDMADGSLARMLFVDGDADVPINRNKASREAPQAVIDGILEARMAYRGSSGISAGGGMCHIPVTVEPSDEFMEAKEAIEERFWQMAVDAGKQGGDKAISKPLYHRGAVRAVQMSMLLDPMCRNVDVLEWAATITEQTINQFADTFIGSCHDTEHERMVKLVEQVIKKAGRKGISMKDFRSLTRSVPTSFKKQIVQELLDANQIDVIEVRGNAKDVRNRKSQRYVWLR